MSLNSETTVSGPFVLNAVAVTFGYTFRIIDAAELEFVKFDPASGAPTIVDPNDYSVDGVGDDDGGNIVFAVAPGNAVTPWTGYVRRKGRMTQPVQLTDTGPFTPTRVMEMVDRQTMFALELREELGRALRGPVGETDLTLPGKAFRGSKILSFDVNGEAECVIGVANVASVAAIADDITDVAAIGASVTAVAGNAANITTLAGVAAALAALGPIAGSISTVAALGIVGILNGAGAPGAGLGVNGNFYIDTTNWAIYGPKAGGAWPAGKSLIGPMGPGSGDMLRANNLSDLTNAASARTNLGLGSAAVVNDGTSGAVYGKLNANLTFSGTNTFSAKNTFTGAGANSPRSSGTDAAWEVLNNASTQNYYFGVHDSDSNKLYIGRGSSPAQGITPSAKVDTGDTWAFLNRPTFNGNTALDTGNGVQKAGDTMTGDLLISKSTNAKTYLSIGNTQAIAEFFVDANAQAYLRTTGGWAMNLGANAVTALTLTAAGESVMASAVGPTSTLSVGYRGLGTPAAQTASTSPGLADVGHMQRHNSGSSHTLTLPTFATAAVPDGCGYPVENVGAGTYIIAAPAGGTLYNDANVSGSITLNQGHGGFVYRDATSGTNVWRYRGSRV